MNVSNWSWCCVNGHLAGVPSPYTLRSNPKRLAICLCLQLKILACNVSGGELNGTIQVNGQLVHPKEFRNQSAVVWQSDVLLSSSTVRLPSSSTSTKIN